MPFELRDTTIEMKTKLFNVWNKSPKFALLEVGTGGGKTYGAIYTASQINPKLNLLIFSTSYISNYSDQWQSSIKEFNASQKTELTAEIWNYDKLVVKKEIKSPVNKNNKKNSPIIKNPYYLEMLDSIRAHHARGEQTLLILDETHLIKSSNKTSQRSEKIISLSREPGILTTLALSATAFSNSLLDLANYLIIAGFYKDKYEFIKRHVKRFDEYGSPIVKDKSGEIRDEFFKDVDMIKNLYRMVTVKVETDHLKPIFHTTHYNLTLNKDRKSLYNRVKTDFKNGFYEFPAQARSAQNNMLGNFLSAQKDLILINIIEQRKRLSFNEIRPILCFYEYNVNFHHLHRLITELYPDIPILSVNGLSKGKTKKITSEPEDPNTIIFIQYRSGAEGLDWQWSNVSVFYEAPQSFEKYVQAKGRNVRDKRIVHEVFHFELEFMNTIDGDRWLCCRNKKKYTKKIADELFLKTSEN